ncbi:uncharacterized protein LOC112004627 [Quercus suber]|uniref:uncharacterized protein LOC112004627 n=1 Tax=Quercus suber TaxID=58331 RepID=UPI000CE1EEA5|nr:uncharacterized protein LOC112004627 [Quercus suber]
MEGEEQIGEMLTCCYSNLFATVNPTELDSVLSGVQPKVSDSMNTELLKPFRMEEVHIALKQMKPDTAPGPDGLPPLFYKNFWDKVGREVSEAVLSMLNSDNILIAHETLHYLKTKRTGKTGYMSMKLDMSKAYDRVEWVYLEKIMERMGFDKKWINLITMCIRSNTRPEVQAAIKTFLGISAIQRYEQYLGLPSLAGKAKKKSFSLIKERIWKKLKGWKEKLLLQAGREILLKAVIQAIPTFTMSCFKLPKGLISKIETLIRKFWWGYRGEQKKIHWISWGKLCQPKKEGGMGFKELIKFNDSLLAKQIWRLGNNEGCLFHRVFKAKFFPNCSVYDCEVSTKGSYAWKSIIQAKHVMELGSVWRIGDGKSVKIRGDRWLPQNSALKIVSPVAVLPPGAMVCDIIDQKEHQWISKLIAQEFLPYEANIIKGIPLSDRNIPDKQVWHASTHGVYTTQSAYKLLALAERNKVPTCSTNRSSSNIWREIWSLQVPYKVRHLIWLVVVWEKDAELMKCTRHKFSVFADLLELIFSLRDRTDVNLLCIIMWQIWNRRNSARVGDSIVEYHHIRAKAEAFLLDFQTAQVLEQRDLGTAGLGVVIRDWRGQVVGALAERIPIPKSAATVEALACRRALHFANEFRIREFVCEGDAEVIIKALLSMEAVHPEYGHVLQDSLVLANGFKVCKFVHIKRVGNSVAHFLARRSKSGMSYRFGVRPFLRI